MKIAITAYVDDVEQTKFADECNLMTYRGQCLDDRFTFVIYVHPDSEHLIDRYDNVTVVPYSVGEDKYYSMYRFAKSLRFVYDMPEPLNEFDFIVKTDTDVLISPAMNKFPFNKEKIYVGRGYYTANDQAKDAIKDAAIRFGHPTYTRISDMHSTVVASRDTVIRLMSDADSLCRDMYFGLEEPGEWGAGNLWRGYYEYSSGACSMYAVEILLSSSEYRKRVIVTTKLDRGSDWENHWEQAYHFHCYHHDFIYSKFQAKYGAYVDLPLQDRSSSSAYCLNMYIERRAAGISNPEKFSKPLFSLFSPPTTNPGLKVQYRFEDEVLQ